MLYVAMVGCMNDAYKKFKFRLCVMYSMTKVYILLVYRKLIHIIIILYI